MKTRKKLTIEFDPRNGGLTEIKWGQDWVGSIKHVMVAQSSGGSPMITLVPYSGAFIDSASYRALLDEMVSEGILIGGYNGKAGNA